MALEPIKPGASDIQAAPEIDLAALAKKYRLAEHARTVPASPSYFSKSPKFNDAFVRVEALYRKYGHLPTLPPADVERVAWKRLKDARTDFNERVKAPDYVRCLFIVKSLHSIHPDLKPAEVTEALQVFKRDIQGFLNKPKPVPIDKYGRALGVGKRKASTARAYVLEGNGEVLINGKTLAEYFGRVHDRETAIWPLTATDRIDKYNVWARVEGGGTTGQADAIKLAIAKGLLAHEPALKPALRRGKWYWLRHASSCAAFAGSRLREGLADDTSLSSRLHYARPENGGKEEARPQEGQKGPHVGQEIVGSLCTSLYAMVVMGFFGFCMSVCPITVLPASCLRVCISAAPPIIVQYMASGFPRSASEPAL